MSTAAIVLAAGMSKRFRGAKLVAPFAGKPVLQHVLDLVATLGLAPALVVLGQHAGAIEAACAWRSELRVRNPRPEGGLSTSLRPGLKRLEDTEADRALVLLGDQPMLTASQVQSILDAPRDPDRPIVVPRYHGTPGNPVLLERGVWRLAADLRGDRGMAQLFERRPDLVRYVEVPGTNPDIDTPEDLRALSRGAGSARSGRTAAVDRSTPSAARPRRT